MTPHDRALDALACIPADVGRDDWVKTCMAAKAAGLSADEVETWSAQAESYDPHGFGSMWKSIKPDGGITAATLFKIAHENGWTNGADTSPDALQKRPAVAPTKAAETPRKPAPGNSPADVWARWEPATVRHEYIATKKAAGVPLDNLRVVSAGDALRIAGTPMAGALVVPGYAPDGKLQTLQFITAAGKKLNMPGAAISGASHVVGERMPGAVVYIVEGIAQAWSCWQATGCAAVCAFGWGNVRRVAAGLRARDAGARIVICPDRGKENDAEKIAREFNGAVVYLPEGEPVNFDVNDFLQRDDVAALGELLEGASAPAAINSVADDAADNGANATRYKLLNWDDVLALSEFEWIVKGVFPATGLAMIFGATMSGKSFLAFDMAAAIAEGRVWFGHRVKAAPVVYAALEASALLKGQLRAWTEHYGRKVPGLQMMMQPFEFALPDDVMDFAAAVPAGAIVFIDTFNRATMGLSENDPGDMGRVLKAASRLQEITGGLVVVIHHGGKDATKGPRGHSLLLAAMDAALEVTREGDYREWKIHKCKGALDGSTHPFKLHVELLGTDGDGDTITSCVVLTTDGSDKPQPSKRTSEASGAILELLRTRGTGMKKPDLVKHFDGVYDSANVYRELKKLVQNEKVHELGGILSAATSRKSESTL
jgi:putative DNA primase/helicase